MKNYSSPTLHSLRLLIKTSSKVSPALLLTQMLCPCLPAQFHSVKKRFLLFNTIISMVAGLIGIQQNIEQLIAFLLLQNCFPDASWHCISARLHPIALLIASAFLIALLKLGRDICKIKKKLPNW